MAPTNIHPTPNTFLKLISSFKKILANNKVHIYVIEVRGKTSE